MSNRNYNFRNSFNIGTIAVKAVSDILVKQPIHINLISVENLPLFQERGVDLIWVVDDAGTKRRVGVEVKADTYYDTGNLFLETVSNMTKETPGCFVSSCADIYAYFFVGVDVLYWIPMKKAQEWFSLNYKRFPEKTTSTGRGSEHFYKTKGVLVPRDVVVQEVYGTKVITIGG